jgi:cyanophycin synthetase
MLPARFNVTEMAGVQVVIDYAHNVAAMRALAQSLAALGPRRTVLLLGLPGDRRDEDLLATVRATLGSGNEYVLYDQTDRRGRHPGEVPRLLRSGLPAEMPSTLTPSQETGIREAWARVRPGERLVVIADEVDEALVLVENLATATLEDGVCMRPISHVPAPVAAA